MDEENYKNEIDYFLTDQISKEHRSDKTTPQREIWDPQTPSNFSALSDEIPNLIANVIQNHDTCQSIEQISNYLRTPGIHLGETFENNEFTDKFCELLNNYEVNSTIKIYILECITSLWYHIDINKFRDSVWIDSDVVDSVLNILTNEDRNVLPLAYFALSNYVAISQETTEYLIHHSVNILDKLLTFTRAWTSLKHARAGLMLALNMLCFRIEEVYEEMIKFIPCFRCHIRNSDSVIRNQACSCLLKLCEYEPAIEACIRCEVPDEIYYVITQNPNNIIRRSFLLMHVFLDSPCREMFLTEEMVDSLSTILDLGMSENSENESNISDIFLVLLSMESSMRHVFVKNFIYEKACDYIHNGFSTLKLRAAVLLSSGLMSVPNQKKEELVTNNEAVEALCSVVALLKDEHEEKIILGTLCSLLFQNFERYADIFIDMDVLDEIESMEDDFTPEIKEISDQIIQMFRDHEQ